MSDCAAGPRGGSIGPRYPRAIDALTRFSPAVREWFTSRFDAPTRAQELGWPAISAGEHTLILAPTGSGKTLAAFLWAIDRLATDPVPPPGQRCRVLYVSPLKALAVDIERNLAEPIAGMRRASTHLAHEVHLPTVALRTGDTPSNERRRLVRTPPDILVTTPESLYLMLTSRARETLRSVRWVIVDEIHSVAATKRGAHLALSLERLAELTPRGFQRIGLSATQRPLDEIAHFLGGQAKASARDAGTLRRSEPGPERPGPQGQEREAKASARDAGTLRRSESGPERPGPQGQEREAGPWRPVTIVDAGSRPDLDVEVVVPVDDMTDLDAAVDSGPGLPREARTSIWPHIHPRLLELIRAHTNTLIFVNARRQAERLAAQLNDLAGDPDLVRAHHGSLARERRLTLEGQLKRGELRALVATSSLELGIDMGAIDLVIQVESPGSVARGLQRIGRAGHHVGEASRGKIFPKYRGDLLETAVVVARMRDGLVEETRYPRLCLDVLAQQIVAACALDEWDVDALGTMVRRAANYSDLTDDVFLAVLDSLSGRYPSDEFSGLRPRLVWDRVAGRVRAREGAARVAIVNGGTIPDRGLFGVFLVDGTRVGELDEEMVYETRVGDTFVLGASSWRVAEITRDRVVVDPAPGEPGRMPFWHGDKPGRPLELGRALGRLVRELGPLPAGDAHSRLRTEHGLDERAATNLVRYLDDQRAATGALPDDRTVLVERFPDEIGDWRMCLLSPFGARVHAPWALALEERLVERLGLRVEMLWSDDGIVIRLPASVETIPLDAFLIDPEEIDDLVMRRLPATPLFAARFREAAARALLLPRRRPGERTPLWQQRQRSADLLHVASHYPAFPLMLETTRECLRDVFDLPGLREVLTDLQTRRTRAVALDTPRASPFAQSLLFGWIAVYMYEDDTPLAERRAAALALDRDLLRDLLGGDELRDLLDGDAIAQVEAELQLLAPGSRRARSPDDLHDLLRDLGALTDAEIALRADGDAASLVATLVEERRAIRLRIAGEARVAAAEDAARHRDALGAAVPSGLPGVFTEPVPDPLADLLARFARTHGPFTTAEAADHFGVLPEAARAALARLEQAGRIVHGELRPGGVERDWCDVEVLRRLRRRSLAALRREVEPVGPEVYARFLATWHHVEAGRRGLDACVETIGQLQGLAIPASVLETEVLRARVEDYRPSMLDELCASGEICWVGAGSLGTRDGRVVLAFRDQARYLCPEPSPEPPTGEIVERLRAHLAAAGSAFWPELVVAAGSTDEAAVLDALWALVWAGEVTNDGFAALRARGLRGNRAPRGRPRPGRLSRLGPPAGAGRWSLTAAVRLPAPSPAPTAHARAMQLLERHGVVTREGVRAEGVLGGFAGVYPTLRAMEDAGRVRRGWFVAGLGAAQFALPGAAERLREERHTRDRAPVVLAATDPAQPYGAVLAWPESAGHPTRAPGALVVLDAGRAAAFVERGAHHVLTFGSGGPGGSGGSDGSDGSGDAPDSWIEALAARVKDGRLRRLEIRRVDGIPVRESPVAETLRCHGFVDGYRGLVLGT